MKNNTLHVNRTSTNSSPSRSYWAIPLVRNVMPVCAEGRQFRLSLGEGTSAAPPVYYSEGVLRETDRGLTIITPFRSIVTDGLADAVQHVDLQECEESFVVLCTVAKDDEFANLAKQLRRRPVLQASLANIDRVQKGGEACAPGCASTR